MDKNYINYVLDGSYKLEELTSKNLNKYKKVIKLIDTYKEEYLELMEYSKNDILDYILSKLDKRCKFNVNFTNNKTLNLMLKLYRDIEYTGATTLEINSIKNEFKSYTDIEWQLEELKNENFINIENRGDLFQIRWNI